MADVNTSPRYALSGAAAGPAFAEVRDAAQTMLAEGTPPQEVVAFLLAALAAVLKKGRELELLIAKLRRAGRSSERVDPEQLAMLFAELAEQQQALDGVPAFDAEAEERQDAELQRELEAAKRASEPVTEPKPKRGWRTHNVVREVHQVAVPVEERTCTHCGATKRKIGTETSRELHYVPGHFVEREYHREKWACTHCKWGVTTAPAPAKVIPRSAATPSLLAHVVVSKYVDHTPLHRLHRIYDRTGATIPVSTLADWVGSVAERVQPLVARLAERVVGDAYVVGTDATGLQVLDPTSPDNVQRGTMWCVVGDETDVVFHYTPTGEGEPGPWTFLAGRTGYLQADASNVFDRLYNGQVASAIEVGCWAHARRKFYALQDTDPRVAYPLMLIRRLYLIERLADLKNLTPEERGSLRRARSGPVLDTLKPWLVLMAADEPPRSDFAQACGYVLNHWTALTRFLEDGRLRPDNNSVERQIRDVALGRKNYLFAGSHEAAERTAVLYSLMRTATLHGLAPLPYLSDVLTKVTAASDPDDLDRLLPGRWQLGNGPP